jgi:hypothetical protein
MKHKKFTAVACAGAIVLALGAMSDQAFAQTIHYSITDLEAFPEVLAGLRTAPPGKTTVQLYATHTTALKVNGTYLNPCTVQGSILGCDIDSEQLLREIRNYASTRHVSSVAIEPFITFDSLDASLDSGRVPDIFSNSCTRHITDLDSMTPQTLADLLSCSIKWE